MTYVDGLPAHALLVHAPVVLVPLFGLATLAVSLRPVWRRRWGWVLLVGTAVALVATVLAYESGQELSGIVGDSVDFADHESAAATARVWVFLWFVLTGAVVVVDRFGMPTSAQLAASARATLVALMIATAVLSTVWVFRTGEEGACLVWGSIGESTC